MANIPLLVACDKAPSGAFNALREYYTKRGHPSPNVILLDGGKHPQPNRKAIEAHMHISDIVVIGMSSSQQNAALEITAAETAIRLGKTFGFYADTPGADTRSHFTCFRHAAQFLFVINEEEAVHARMRYPNARVVATGNPEWATFFLPISIETVGAELALDGAKIVYVPFTKTSSINVVKARMALDAVAAAHITGTGRFLVVLNRHLGDRAALETYTNALKDYPTHIFAFSTLTEGEILPAASVLIGPASTASMHAMARQIPIFDVMNAEITSWLLRDIGNPRTYASQKGGSIEVFDADDLTHFLAVIHSAVPGENTYGSSLQKMRERQKTVVPYSAPDEAVQKMAEVLDSI